MELKEFVETTIVQIAEGIAAANAHLRNGDTGAVINPAETHGRVPKEVIRPVEFDVALTVSEQSTTKEVSKSGGKLGVLSVASISGNLEGEESGSNRREAISRVKFSVLMQQPANLTYRGIPTSDPNTDWKTL